MDLIEMNVNVRFSIHMHVDTSVEYSFYSVLY